MLQQMGWKEKGLGKDEEGRTEHVKVQNKRDCLGMCVDVVFITASLSISTLASITGLQTIV